MGPYTELMVWTVDWSPVARLALARSPRSAWAIVALKGLAWVLVRSLGRAILKLYKGSENDF